MLVLTRDELKAITGSSHKVKQRAELDCLGIPYRVNTQGWPVVLRSAAIEALGGKQVASDQQPKEATIDMSFLDDHLT